MIGKSKTPRCFKNVKLLQYLYRNQQKAWMNGEHFKKWVENLDRTFRGEFLVLMLLVDNCPAHPHIENFSNINLIFLPPNTASVLQPMNQGVIHCLKAHYRKRIMTLCIKALDKNKPLPNISVIQAIKDLVSSWNSVAKETIINCFKKAGINDSRKQPAITDTHDTFKPLTEDLSHLRQIDQNTVQKELSAESFIDLDNNVVTIITISSDEDNDAEILDPEEDNKINEDIDDVDVDVEGPT